MNTIYHKLKVALFSAVLFISSQVFAQPGIKDCSNGFHNNLMIGLNDSLYVWGENVMGQMGDGTTTNVISVKGAGVKAIGVAGGAEYSLYIKTDSTIMGAGRNDIGQLGDGTTTQRLVWAPVNLASTIHFKQIAAAANHSLGLTSGGLVYAWGLNAKGELGDSTTTMRSTPVVVHLMAGGNLSNIIKISCGTVLKGNNTSGGHSVALKSDGTVWTWGYNNSGQLGDNTNVDKIEAVQVVGIGGVGFLTGVIDIATSGNSSFALLSDSTVVSWGDNANGQLGNGIKTDRYVPGRVKINATTDITSIKQISASSSAGNDDFLAMLKSNGRIWNVGDNSKGQLGAGGIDVTDRTYAIENSASQSTRHYSRVVANGHYQVQISADSSGRYCQTGHQTAGSFGDGTPGTANVSMADAECYSIPLASLPVTLSSFSGVRKDENTVILNWITETEINNDKFEIEYSYDGIEYDKIGEVRGKGTSFKKNNYQFIHLNAHNHYNSYYRLRQVDFNGNYEYHKVVIVKPEIGKNNIYATPNPTNGSIQVSLMDITFSDYEIKIMDQSGRVLLSKNGHVEDNTKIEEFDLNSFDKGFYYVIINTGYGTKIETIAKQ